MAEVNFYALNVGSDFNINTNGSGIGFFGSSFGRSVSVGFWQDTSFLTDSNGITQGSQINNVKYVHPNSGELAGGNIIAITGIPNYQATINVRFTHDTEVQVQNAEWRIYDRISPNNDPSGLTCYCAEIIHPSTLQTEQGSGDTAWLHCYGSGQTLSLSDSPGTSGLWAGSGVGSTHQSLSHDYYIIISASPDSVGSKTYFSGYFSCEYL